VLEAVFVLLQYPSPSRRIFIGSHSLPPPLWFAVSVLQYSALDEEQFNEEEAAANDREGGDDVEGRLESIEPPMIPTP
jgi:hypothetical protein